MVIIKIRIISGSGAVSARIVDKKGRVSVICIRLRRQNPDFIDSDRDMTVAQFFKLRRALPRDDLKNRPTA